MIRVCRAAKTLFESAKINAARNKAAAIEWRLSLLFITLPEPAICHFVFYVQVQDADWYLLLFL
jgi:hypothetical protein